MAQEEKKLDVYEDDLDFEDEPKNTKKKSKKTSNKEILADFLSQTIMVDKKIRIFIYKKIDEQFQLASDKPFKPPLLGEQIYQDYGDGIYRMDLRNVSGSPIFPNTIYFEIKNGIAKQIPSNYALDEKKTEANTPLQGAIILTPEAVRELLSALRQNQTTLDLSFISEVSKNLLKTQIELFNEMAKNQIEVMKNVIENMYASEEEEEEEEIDQETIAKAVAEGNYELIEELLEDTFGANGKKFAKILRLVDGYLTAQKLQEELKRHGETRKPDTQGD